MTAQNLSWVWDVNYAPFGQVLYLYTNPEVMNARFPGQWFQLETGLAYNWHRHYDPTTGRYLQPDPLLSDESGATLAGIRQGAISTTTPGVHPVARSMGWQEARDVLTGSESPRPMLQDGPSVYGYAGQSPLTLTDPTGTQAPAGILACPFGGLFNPACDVGLVSSGITIGVGVIGICEMAGHKKGARPSTEQKHEEGDARRKADAGGEKGDEVRRLPRQRPAGFKGPYPPKPSND